MNMGGMFNGVRSICSDLKVPLCMGGCERAYVNSSLNGAHMTPLRRETPIFFFKALYDVQSIASRSTMSRHHNYHIGAFDGYNNPPPNSNNSPHSCPINTNTPTPSPSAVHLHMHIHHTLSTPSTITFHLDLSHHELQHLTTHHTAHRQYTLTQRTFRFLLPDAISSFDDVHPDLWGLLVLLVVHPFVHKELQLSFAVSPSFADAVSKAFHHSVQVYPMDPDILPRQAGHRGQRHQHSDKVGAPPPSPLQPSVAFNGRVHSTMAAAIVGNRAQLVAMDHWNATSGARTSPYPVDALYYSLDLMESQGFRVAMVKTDVASLCEPYGIAHPLAACAGNVMLADALGLHTIFMGSSLASMRAMGPIVSSAHQHQHQTPHQTSRRPPTLRVGDVPTTIDTLAFRTGQLLCNPGMHGDRDSLESWREVFAAVDLSLEFPLCGACDTFVVKLLHEHKFWDNTNYCLYGRPKYKCGECVECVYYDATHRAVTNPYLGAAEFTKVWNRCTQEFPEATTCVLDLQTANRWHLFWIGLVTRRDTMPSTATKGAQKHAFDVFHAYASQRFGQMRFGLHVGMMGLLGDGCRDLVVEGWKRLHSGGGGAT
jgi:hypothetical protein